MSRMPTSTHAASSTRRGRHRYCCWARLVRTHPGRNCKRRSNCSGDFAFMRCVFRLTRVSRFLPVFPPYCARRRCSISSLRRFTHKRGRLNDAGNPRNITMQLTKPDRTVIPSLCFGNQTCGDDDEKWRLPLRLSRLMTYVLRPGRDLLVSRPPCSSSRRWLPLRQLIDIRVHDDKPPVINGHLS